MNHRLTTFNPPGKQRISVARGILVAAALLLGGCSFGAGSGSSTNSPSGEGKPVAPRPASTADLPAGPIPRPQPPPSDYVGSAACAKCHEEICHTFARHPMGRSSALTPGPDDLEDFAPDKSQFEAPSGLLYRVEKSGERIFHHEIGSGRGDRPLYDQSAIVSLAIGSGTRGKSYGINRDGLIFMSPISWYAKDGGFFQLSPGYERGNNNARFERRVPEACLNCHIGRLAPHPTQADRLAPPYVHEMAIGCERCHGPGQRHVQRQEAGDHPLPDDSIVNPARLPPRKREAVCNQCHLHGEFPLTRFGRRPFDFRPGMEMEEVFLIFVSDDHVDPLGRSDAVSQVAQMRSSACYQASSGKMGCVSCHNPHDKETPVNRVGFYRGKCLTCHEKQGCSLPMEKQQEEPASGSCIHCHMPPSASSDVAHASQTDHRVLRDPEAAGILADHGPGGFESWRLFDNAHERLPAWEVRRARGLAMIFAVTQGKASHGRLAEARELLLPLTKIPLEDGALYFGLGQGCMLQQRHGEAIPYLEEAVRLEPGNDMFCETLARACYSTSQFAKAKEAIARCLALNPWHARNFTLQAQILAKLGEREPALSAAARAYELDPNLRELREQILAQLATTAP